MPLTPRRPALLLLPAAVAAVSNACTYQIGNRFFDLSPLARADHDYTARLNGFTYHFNLCAPTMKMCNGQLAPASKWRGAGEGKCNNLGHVDTQIATFVDDKHPGRGVRLSWSGGDSCKKEARPLSCRFFLTSFRCALRQVERAHGAREGSSSHSVPYVSSHPSSYSHPPLSLSLKKKLLSPHPLTLSLCADRWAHATQHTAGDV